MDLLTGDPQTNNEPTPIFNSVFIDFVNAEKTDRPRDEKGRFKSNDD